MVSLLPKTNSTRVFFRLVALEKAGVPAGPIYDMEQAWSDPQVKARDMEVKLEHDTVGATSNIGLAVKMHGTPGYLRTASPWLGQHTDEILEFAGYSADEIFDLRRQKIVDPD